MPPEEQDKTAERQKRLKAVRAADANSRLEGIYRDPGTDATVDRFIDGDIEATDIVALFKGR